MNNYLYILIILYNLHLLLSFYIEIMIKNINIFNYKNSSNFLNKFFFWDIINVLIYKNNYLYLSINKLINK